MYGSHKHSIKTVAQPWPTGVAHFASARVIVGEWHVLLPNKDVIVNPSGHKSKSVIPISPKQSTSEWQAEILPTVERIDDPVVLLGGRNNYYHNLIDYMINYYYIEKHQLTENHKILFTHHNRSFNEATIDFLSIPRELLIRPNYRGVLRCKSLTLVPRTVVRMGHVNDTLPIRWMREHALASTTRKTSKHIYISRRQARVRHVSNEDQVMAALSQFGFTSYVLEDLTLAEQAAIFAGADVLIGPHGAAFANMIFMKPSSLVIELMPFGHRFPEYFSNLAIGCGHNFHRVTSRGRQIAQETPESQSTWRNSTGLADPSFEVDIAELLQALKINNIH